VNGTVCSEEEIATYSKAYLEVSKRPRSADVLSPTNTQEAKKPKNLKLNIIKNAGRQRSLSTSNSPIGAAKPITDFFSSNVSSPSNTRTDYYKYQE
jgi:hypothetical protein